MIRQTVGPLRMLTPESEDDRAALLKDAKVDRGMENRRPRRAKAKVKEAGDDHFYGAWRGGAKSEGGRPGGASLAEKPFGKKHGDGKGDSPGAVIGAMTREQAEAENTRLSAAPFTIGTKYGYGPYPNYSPLNTWTDNDGNPAQQRTGKEVFTAKGGPDTAWDHDEARRFLRTMDDGRFDSHAFNYVSSDLRAGTKGHMTDQLDVFDRVASMGVTTSSGHLWRGMAVDAGAKVGDTLVDKGFPFTTTSAGKAARYAYGAGDRKGGRQPVVVRYSIPKGFHLLPDIRTQDVQDFVLPRNLRWRVVSSEQVNGVTVLGLEPA